MREGIVSNIVSIIQLLSTTSACPASQPSREKRGIEIGKRERHTHTQRYTAFILSALGAACVKAPGELAVSVCRYMACASRKQPTAKE